MNKPVVILYSTSDRYEKSVLSWKNWCDKYNLLLLNFELNKNQDIINRYLVYELLESQNIDYDSVLMVSDTTLVTTHCKNFIKDINKIMYARWFGSYGNLFEIMSLDTNLKFDIDNWINTDLVFFPKEDLKTLKEKINNNFCINFINNLSDVLINYNEIYDLPLNLMKRNIDNEIQLSYYYNTCNMQINELLHNFKFLKLNPYVLNFNGMNENDTSYFLNETYKHYYL